MNTVEKLARTATPTLNETQVTLTLFLYEFYLAKGFPATHTDIESALGISKGKHSQSALEKLEKAGLVRSETVSRGKVYVPVHVYRVFAPPSSYDDQLDPAASRAARLVRAMSDAQTSLTFDRLSKRKGDRS